MAGGEGVAALGEPGAEERGERHADGGAALGAAATADGAGDDQRAPATLGAVVVRRQGGVEDKREQFIKETVDALAARRLG